MRLQPETAHGLAIAALKGGFVPAFTGPQDKRLAVKAAGLTFPNPIGIAAGFDKNAEAANALLKLGFGFAEVGTLTPRPQPGNPQPRLFRLPKDRAVINRLGFNNEGHGAALERLKARPRRAGIVGVNIGANKDSADRIADYAEGVRVFASVADYFTVNISSPNTPGLRDLQDRESLAVLLDAVTEARQAAANISGKRVPIFVKIAPDLDEEGLDAVAETVSAKAVDGIVLTNTTLARNGLIDADLAHETGGLSGRPLFERSTIALARMRRAVGPEMALIAAGGVDSAETALTKIRAGADLVQVYTGFIYGGPTLPRDIVAGLSAILDRDGTESIAAYRDAGIDAWAERPLNP
jgi:dihydroorotate dehydrogenase